MEKWNAVRGQVTRQFERFDTATLTVLLLLAALVIIIIALSNVHPLIKAAVLAYVILP